MAPMDYLRGLVRGRVLRHLSHITDKAPHPISVVLGDFNASWNGLSGPHKGLPSWAATTGLLNPFSYVAHTSPRTFASFYSGLRPVGLIDNFFLSQSYPGLVSLTALDDGSFWSTISDHRPILLGLSLSAFQARRLGRPLTRPNWPKTEVPSQPTLLRQYQAQLEDRPAEPISDPPSSARYLFQVCVDSTAVAASLAPASVSKGKRWKDGWSPPMMCLKANLEALWQIWGHLRGTGGRSLWKTQADMDTHLEQILAPWERVVQHHYKDDPPAYHAMLARGGHPPSYWRTAPVRNLDSTVLEAIHLVKGQLHGRNRNYLRMLINAQVYRRETSRLKGKLGRVIRSILHEDIQFYPIETLRVASDYILTDGSQIHQAVTAHFQEWYRAPPAPDHVEAWWLNRDRQAFLGVGRQAAIPDPLLQILWTGITHVPRRVVVAEELERTLSSPPSLVDFQLAIANIRSSTSPGASGLTYGMIKHWPASLVESVYHHLASLWATKAVPSWWRNRWLCPIPKVPDPDPSMDDLRPLMLVEVLRKLWVGLIIDKISQTWDRHGILSPSQHGFRPKHGTDTALVEILNILEQAQESSTPVYSSSWDIKRAFDSISRPVMALAWNRLGVPLDVANWLAYMDEGGTIMIRTPSAMRHFGPSTDFPTSPLPHCQSFSGGLGTPQGDVSSPAAWVAVFDILLRSLEATLSVPYGVRGHEDTIYPAPDVAYADDLNTFSASCQGLQAQADTVSAFTSFFGLRIAAGKLRLGVFGGAPVTPPDTITIHHQGWVPQSLPLKYSGIVRILGFHFQLDGSHQYQHLLTKQRLQLACAAMSTAIRSSPASVAMTAMISSLSRAAYTGQFGAWDQSDLMDLETPLNSVLRRIAGFRPTTATQLLYMAPTQGGMGFTSLQDYIQRRKWSLVHRTLLTSSTSARAMGGLLSRAARQGGYPTRPSGAYTRLHPGTPSSQPCWGASLGSLALDTFSRLCTGLPHGQLDLPIIPPEQLSRPLARRLRDIGLHLLGDLTYLSSGTRAWIPEVAFFRLGLPTPYPASPCPQQPYVNCHGGQFWALRSSPGHPGGIYEILNLPSDTGDRSAVLYYRRWVGVSSFRRRSSDRSYLSPGHKIQPLFPLTGGAISWEHYLTLECFKKQAHARLLTCTHSGRTRTLLHAFWEPPSFADPPLYSPVIQEALSPCLAASDSWEVYADGSWYPAASTAESILGEAGTHTGGCSLIFAPSTSPLTAGVTVLRVDARTPTRVHGGGPRMMELVGVTTSIILLHALGKRGRVYTDNQGIVTQLSDSRRLRRTGLMPCSPSVGHPPRCSDLPPLATGPSRTT